MWGGGPADYIIKLFTSFSTTAAVGVIALMLDCALLFFKIKKKPKCSLLLNIDIWHFCISIKHNQLLLAADSWINVSLFVEKHGEINLWQE